MATCMWSDANGAPRELLRGCIDVDLTATPFTNTLPIRRLKLERGERRVIRVAYVRVPELSVSAVEQAYTCIEPNRRYHYEGLDTSFTADITVDADGARARLSGPFQTDRVRRDLPRAAIMRLIARFRARLCPTFQR